MQKEEIALGTLISRGLYKLISKDKDIAILLLTDELHPVFKAHFENNPILPGFLHIDITAEVFGLDLSFVKSAKYFEIVRPNERITIKVIKDNVYELSKDNGIVVSRLELKSSK